MKWRVLSLLGSVMPPKWIEDWRGFLRSIATYTRIPIKVDWDKNEKHTPSVCFLPLVGVMIALVSAWPLLIPQWTSQFQALVMMLSALLITGAFHEDGLMDAVDGLVGGWTPEQRLSIMKDSRIGSYGALSMWFMLAIKWWLLSHFLDMSQWDSETHALLGWISMHVGARWLPLALMQTLTYVTAGKSKASSMISVFAFREWGWVGVSIALVVLFLGLLKSFALLLVLIALFISLRQYLSLRLQGYNGDTLGASEQIGEIVILFTLVGFSA